MKKVLFVAFMVMAFVALGSMAAFACGEHKASTTADASKVDAKQASATTTKAAGCCASKASTTSASTTTTNATMASSKTTTANGAACTVADKAACEAKLAAGQCTIEDCLKACQAKFNETLGADAANYHLVAMSIKGMTCGGCETSVKTALMAVEGVNSVIDVCHKAGFAVVSVKNDAKFENLSVVKAVSAKGFESEIIPAVSVTTTNTNTTDKAECSAHKKDGSK
ncbi:MAG TPA: cation transporter [candidate division Zixibacteria bacterium]|nr:cation transporter [candidate division Zixibacteria bacterium]